MKIPNGMEDDFAKFEEIGEAGVRAYLDTHGGLVDDANERRRRWLNLKAEQRAVAAEDRERRMTEATEASAGAASGARWAAWGAAGSTAILAFFEFLKYMAARP